MKVRKETAKKFHGLIRQRNLDSVKVMLIGYILTIAATIPITFIAVMLGPEHPTFPKAAGFATVMTIFFRYQFPRIKQIGEFYDQKIKDLVKEEEEYQKTHPEKN